MARRPRPHPLAMAALVGLGVVLLQALLVPLFAAPAAHLEPRDLPVVVAGPSEAAAALPPFLKITAVPDAAAADAALRDREAYGAFIFGPDGPALHTASAASPTVATMLGQAASQAAGRPVPVTDVVPTDPADPRGAAFAAGFLPLALTGLVAGIAIALAVRSRAARLTGLIGYAVGAGLVGALILQSWLGVVPGGYLAVSGALALFALATAATITGLAALLGYPGIPLGALVTFLVANPLSAISAAPELLPRPWGTVGQWLPIGAGGTLLRSTAYFNGAGGGLAAAVLGGYAAIGLLLVLAGRATLARREPAPAGTPAESVPAAA
ncbi:hypothetical protein [Rhizomonospora bruguierae]|uniref:hypothetical protein n=1 Tax=Rhizomonospora bruguierae TaxID=1581705 RepID=UPI001BCB7FD5|nr:hypothetical protein [Micromonospora sp. NBRC 107566]